jgi:hypothetical protein
MTERGKTAEKARRQRRLGAARRENLKRRKAQARGRAQDEPEPGEAEFTSPQATSDKPER